MRPLYHEFAWAYDAVLERDTEPLLGMIVSALEANGVGEGSSVLDAGCGTGSYALELARRAYVVTGIDRSAALVAEAQRKAPGVDFRVEDLLSWRPPAPFDAALARGVLNDFVDEEERDAAVTALAGALRPGGLAVADVRDWEGTVQRQRESAVFERTVSTPAGEVVFRSETRLDPVTQRMHLRERIQVAGGEARENSFTMRCWSKPELLERFAAAGFGSASVDVAHRSDRLLLVARR